MTARAKLAAELMPSEWKMLAMHYRRDALFVVTRELSLLEAAVAIAEDDAERVRAWIEAGHIARPTAKQAAAWENEPGSQFVSAIVQPYVLAQRLEDFAAATPTE